MYVEGAKRLLGQCRLCSAPLSAVFPDAQFPVSSTSVAGAAGAGAGAGAGERAGPVGAGVCPYVPPAPDVPLDCWLGRVQRLQHALARDSLAQLSLARVSHSSPVEFDKSCSALFDQVLHSTTTFAHEC